MAKKLTSTKAKKILHDKEVHGQPLTDKQRRFFGAIASGAKPYKAQNGIEGTMGGLTDKGFNYNGAWGGTMQMGGSVPGAVGFTYARTVSAAPSNGPYAKKTKASAQNGMEMKYYQEGLDFKPKTISKNGGWLDKYEKAQDGLSIRDLARQQQIQNINRGDIQSLPGARIQVPLSEEQLEANRRNKAAQQAIANQPTVGKATTPIDTEKTKKKNIQYAKATGKRYDEKTGKVEPRFTGSTAKTLEKASENIVEPMLTLEGAMGLTPLVKGVVKRAASVLPTTTSSFQSVSLKPSILESAVKRITSPKAPSKVSEYFKYSQNLPQDVPVSDIDKLFQKNIDWIKSDEYIARRMANTGETRKQIEKSTDRWINDFKKRGTLSFEAPNIFDPSVRGAFSPNSEAFFGLIPALREPSIKVRPDLSDYSGILEHEIKHAYSPAGKILDESLYKKYPTLDVGQLPEEPWYKQLFKTPKPLTEREKFVEYLADKREQQVRGLRLYDKIREDLGIKDFRKITESEFTDWKDKFYNPATSFKIREAGYWDADDFLKAALKQRPKGSTEKETNKTILDFLNKIWAVPAVTTAGVAGMEQKQDGGEIPVDPLGYWNPENEGNPVIIPSNIITMEGVDQPLIGISDTGDIQYMEPGEDYEFDGEYVTEYPVAKNGVSVNNADAQPIKKLDQLLNFTNYNKPTKGGWLDKYQ